ncbi:MAG: CusA/CzcA family heavy metal efflux RND transporter [Pseudomonadota bacterium]
MLERLITFALKQRVLILGAALVLVIWGIIAIKNLPIQAFPDVQDVQVQVVTQVPGQAPPEVERSVTMPIEREMNGIPGLAQVRSVSITGLSVVTLTFADRTDDYFARQQVLEKLANVTLPPGVQPTLAPLTTAVGEIYRYVLEAPRDMPLTEVRALQDWVVRPTLRSTPGVADVVSFGGAIKEYQVRADPYRLRKYNLTLAQLSQALANNSVNTGGGFIRRGDEALVVRSVGLFTNVDDIGRVVVASANGTPVYVSDVADVEIGPRTRSGYVDYNRQSDVVEGIVQMVKGRNPAVVIADLKTRIDSLNAHGLPPGVRLKSVYDRTQLIGHTVHTVTENLLTGAFLVVVILVIFLRNLKAALIVASIIPLSLLFAFIGMDLKGVSANLISLGAVDFGILVDSAVVLVEAFMVRLALAAVDQHPSHDSVGWRWHTLKSTAVEVGRPVLFAKAIIISAFLPIFTFQRVEGKIFSPMALTLSFAILGAILITLTLIPVLLSFTLRNNRMAERHSRWMHALQVRYRALLAFAFRWRKTVVGLSVLLLAASLLLAPRLGSEFLPKLDEGNIWLTLTLPPSTALDKTKEVEERIRAILLSYPEVSSVIAHMGRPDDGTDPKGPNNMEIMANLAPREHWRFAGKEALIRDMERRMESIPGVHTNFSQVIEDNVEEALSGVKGEIAIKIFGPDLEVLEEKAEEVARVVSGIPGAVDVAAIKVGGLAQLNIELNRDRLARYGLNASDVADVVQTALAGRAVNAFYDGERRFDVTLRLDKPYRDSVEAIGELMLNVPGSDVQVPLSALADISVREGAARISREGGGRNVAVKANLLGRDQGGFVAEAMRKVKREVKLPPGYRMTWGGQFENQQRAMKRLEVIVPVSVLLIFILLFWVFQSVKNAFLILLMIPFSLIGGLAGLGLAGLHLSVSAAVGFIALAGISVQNGVIMVEQIKEFLREGQDSMSAILDGAARRLRPVLMTALMAGLGLLPAALSHGIGSETQRPFAVVIVGGLVSATALTLLLLPILFPYFSDESGAGE